VVPWRKGSHPTGKWPSKAIATGGWARFLPRVAADRLSHLRFARTPSLGREGSMSRARRFRHTCAGHDWRLAALRAARTEAPYAQTRCGSPRRSAQRPLVARVGCPNLDWSCLPAAFAKVRATPSPMPGTLRYTVSMSSCSWAWSRSRRALAMSLARGKSATSRPTTCDLSAALRCATSGPSRQYRRLMNATGRADQAIVSFWI